MSTSNSRTAATPSADVLTGAFEAVAASLLQGGGHGSSTDRPCDPLERGTRVLRDLRDALLAEHMDSGSDAAARCEALRGGCVSALRGALANWAETEELLGGDDASPHVRIEVRGTAGREVRGRAFTVGRAAECDVQVYGDPSVSRLQFLVVLLPKGVIVIDAWSGSGTRVTRRSAEGAEASLHSSMPNRRRVFALARNERATLMVGSKTTVSFGPAAKADQHGGERIRPPPIPTVARDLRPNSTPATIPATFTPTLVLSDPDQGLAQQQADVSVAAGPMSTSVLGGGMASRTAQPSSSVGAQAQPSLGSASPSRSRRPGAAGTKKARRALRVGCKSVWTGVRIHRSATMRSQLVWRCYDAERAGLLSDEQCKGLEERLRCPNADFHEVREILDGLGCRPAPEGAAAPMEGSACQLSRGSRVRICGLELAPELNGKTGVCEEWLAERGRWAVKLEDGGEVKAMRTLNLVFVSALVPTAGVSLPELESNGERNVTCTTAGCGETLTLERTESRRRFQCVCGAAPRCTACGESPYHYHSTCGQVAPLRQRWSDWCNGRGRTAYRGLRKRAVREATAQRRALRDVSVAGRNARQANLLAARANFIKGEGVRHFFTQCTFCGSNGKCIVGPRFRCIHCPAFDCCLKCEPRLADDHPADHVFEILFECEFDWEKAGVQLPLGTRARIRQHPVDMEVQSVGAAGAAASSSGAGAPAALDVGAASKQRKRRGYGLEGVIKGFKKGRYDVELADGGVTRHVLPQELQPLLTQSQAQKLLVCGAGAKRCTADS